MSTRSASSTMANETEYLGMLMEYNFVTWLRIIWPPVIVLLGLPGNIISIIIFSQRNMRHGTTSLYLIVMAITDIFVLLMSSIPFWVTEVFQLDVRALSGAVCKSNMFLICVLTDFSVWTLVGIIVERAVSVKLHNPIKWTTRKAALALVFIGIFLFALNAHLLHGFRLSKSGKCEVALYNDYTYTYFFNEIWMWIDLCLFSCIPIVFLVIGNIVIIRKATRNVRNVHPFQGMRGMSNTSRQIAKILLTLSAVYLLTTLVCICLVALYAWPPIRYSGVLNGKFFPSNSLAELLMETRNAVNFYLYCLTSARFRREFVRLIIGINRPRLVRRYVDTRNLQTLATVHEG